MSKSIKKKAIYTGIIIRLIWFARSPKRGGRLRDDIIWDYKFVCLSHNTLRGAAGGAVLMAELLAAKGYFD